jgi:Tol biopolymer transport system component
MTIDGTRQQRLTASTGVSRPAWNPNGKQLAYISLRDSRRTNIWLMNSDGNGKQKLTRHGMNYVYDPAWSPDGQYMIYVVSAEREEQRKKSNLCVVTLDGSRMFCFMDHPARNECPDWHLPPTPDEKTQSVFPMMSNEQAGIICSKRDFTLYKNR